MKIDKSLVKLMRKGDEPAFTLCYQTLSPFIYSVALRICGRAAVAEEITQDSFIKAFNSLEQLKNDTHFVPWIKRIAFNYTVTHLRKDKESTLTGEVEQDDILTDEFDSLVVHQNQLEFLLSHISSDAKLIIWLFIVEGYSHTEIAELTNKTQSYSKSIVSRSLAKLRKVDKGARYAL